MIRVSRGRGAVAGCGVHVPRLALGQLQLSTIHSPCTRRGRVHMLRNPHAAYAASRSLSLCGNQIQRFSLGQVRFVTIYLSMFEFHCPRLTALDIKTTEARAHPKDCCTPRSPRVHVKNIARINGCMSA